MIQKTKDLFLQIFDFLTGLRLLLNRFKLILQPIADVCVAKEQRELVDFESFFTHTICHECCHGIGPHTITLPNGQKSTVRLVSFVVTHLQSLLHLFTMSLQYLVLEQLWNWTQSIFLAKQNGGCIYMNFCSKLYYKSIFSLTNKQFLDIFR